MSLPTKMFTAVLVLLLGGVALACDPVTPTGEVATARLRVDPGPDPSLQDLVVAESTVARYADMAESRAVAQAVITKLGLDRSARDLQGAIDADAGQETLELTIEVRDEDPEAARVIALALGNEMIERVEGRLVGKMDQREAEAMRNLVEVTDEREEPSWRCIPEVPASCIVTSTDASTTSPDERSLPSVMRNRLVWSEKPAAPGVADA